MKGLLRKLTIQAYEIGNSRKRFESYKFQECERGNMDIGKIDIGH